MCSVVKASLFEPKSSDAQKAEGRAWGHQRFREHLNDLWVQMMERRSETSPPASSGPPLFLERRPAFNSPLWEMTMNWVKVFGPVEPVSHAPLHPSTIDQVPGTW